MYFTPYIFPEAPGRPNSKVIRKMQRFLQKEKILRRVDRPLRLSNIEHDEILQLPNISKNGQIFFLSTMWLPDSRKVTATHGVEEHCFLFLVWDYNEL